jgi:hypothetical protein
VADGIPIYPPADRNPQGMTGPIAPDALDEQRIRAAICVNPLVTDPDCWQAPRLFRLVPERDGAAEVPAVAVVGRGRAGFFIRAGNFGPFSQLSCSPVTG